MYGGRDSREGMEEERKGKDKWRWKTGKELHRKEVRWTAYRVTQ